MKLPHGEPDPASGTLQHTMEPDCPACAAMDRLANNVQTAMDNARGLSGGDRMGAVAGALGSLLALQGLGNGATFEQANGMRMVLATIMHDHFEHKWNDLHRAAPAAAAGGADVDPADRPDNSQWASVGIVDRRVAGAISPADPANLHRRRDDLDIHDRNMAMMLRRLKLDGKVH